MNPLNVFEGFFYLFTFNFTEFVNFFNLVRIEITWVIFLILCFSSILIFLRFFGKSGLYIYTVIAIIAGNIQVLKIVKFPFFSEPIALGTILFASTFLCTDILAEYYGPKSARKNIILGFVGFLFMTIVMLFTVAFQPLNSNLVGEEYSWAFEVQQNLLGIFMPFPIFFAASMMAYLSSQFFDVWFFQKISKITNSKYLWLRNNASTFTSALIDNTIFSIFAWIIFNPNPETLTTIIGFIFGTYLLRIFIAILDTPFLYSAKFFILNHQK